MLCDKATKRAPSCDARHEYDIIHNMKFRFTARRGQAMVEYSLALCALLVVFAVMYCYGRAAKSHVVRTERITGSEYP